VKANKAIRAGTEMQTAPVSRRRSGNFNFVRSLR